MCFARRQLDATSRRIYVAGNLCLVTGLMLQLLHTDFAHRHSSLCLGLRFVLICSAIVLLFWSTLRSCGCSVPPERKS